MKIYKYVYEDEPENLPIEKIWMEEDYPNDIMSNTPNQTLLEYEIAWDKEHNLPPSHPVGEERNFIPYVAEGKYKRIKFEKLYTVYYYETENLETFMRENPELKVELHYGFFFVRTWYE